MTVYIHIYGSFMCAICVQRYVYLFKLLPFLVRRSCAVYSGRDDKSSQRIKTEDRIDFFDNDIINQGIQDGPLYILQNWEWKRISSSLMEDEIINLLIKYFTAICILSMTKKYRYISSKAHNFNSVILKEKQFFLLISCHLFGVL